MNASRLRFFAFLVSLVIHGFLFLSVTTVDVSAKIPQEERVVTKVRFKKVIPAPPEKKVEKVTPKVVLTKKVKPVEVVKKVKHKVKQTQKPKPVVVVKPKVVAKLKPVPELVADADIVLANQTPPADTDSEPVSKTPQANTDSVLANQTPPVDAGSEPVSKTPQANTDSVLKEYLEVVLGRIEQEKFYPGSARRRGIQADVSVRFTILSDGRVENVVIDTNSPTVLQRAARSALMSASPLPRPPQNVSEIINVEYQMEFALE